jgi:hypothetical protein
MWVSCPDQCHILGWLVLELVEYALHALWTPVYSPGTSDAAFALATRSYASYTFYSSVMANSSPGWYANLREHHCHGYSRSC